MASQNVQRAVRSRLTSSGLANLPNLPRLGLQRTANVATSQQWQVEIPLMLEAGHSESPIVLAVTVHPSVSMLSRNLWFQVQGRRLYTNKGLAECTQRNSIRLSIPSRLMRFRCSILAA